MYNPSWLNTFSTVHITLVVMVLIFVCYWLGLKTRKYKDRKYPGLAGTGIGAIEGSLLGLLALILGFTFSMSSSRYDKRMNIIVEEANDIGTALLRADLFPDSIRSEFRVEMKQYIDQRILFFEAGRDIGKIQESLDSAEQIQGRIWKIASAAVRSGNYSTASIQMIPALNQMFDIVTTRNAILLAKVPDLILILLFLLCFTSAFVMGYAGGRSNDWVVTSCFSIMIGLTIYMIIDLDRPRSGLITNAWVNYHIKALKANFK